MIPGFDPLALVQTNPDLMSAGEPGWLALADDPETAFLPDAELRATLDALRRPSTLAALVMTPSAELLEALATLCQLGVVLPVQRDAGPHGPSHAAEVRRAYAEEWMLRAGVVATPTALLSQAGLCGGFPGETSNVLAAGDRYRHRGVYLEAPHPAELQWNPYCGAFYVDARALGLNRNRWIGSRREAAARLLYITVHETVHMQLARVGLAGLLGRLAVAEIAEYHHLCEAIAGQVTDLEIAGELAQQGYWQSHWPAAVHLGHTTNSNPSLWLGEAGIGDRAARAALIERVFCLGERVDPWPRRPEQPGARAVLDGYVAAEAAYARKQRSHIGPAWTASYWSAPEMRAWVARFASGSGRFQGPDGVVEVSSLEELKQNWAALTIDARPGSDRDEARQLGGLELQRLAMKVAELRRAVWLRRLVLEDDARAACGDRLDEEWSHLDERHARWCTANASSSDAEELVEQLHARRRALGVDLADRCGSDAWELEHPLFAGELLGWEQVSYREVLAASRPEPQALQEVLRFVAGEARSYLRLAGDHGPAAEAAGEAITSANLLEARITGPTAGVVQEAKAWLEERAPRLGLRLRYPLSWIEERPFVEPACGFRFG